MTGPLALTAAFLAWLLALLFWLFRHKWVTIEMLKEERVTKRARFARRYDTFYTFHEVCAVCGKKRIRVWRSLVHRRWEAKTDADIAVDEANKLLKKKLEGRGAP